MIHTTLDKIVVGTEFEITGEGKFKKSCVCRGDEIECHPVVSRIPQPNLAVWKNKNTAITVENK